MKTIRNIVAVAIVALLASCASSVKFPVSTVVPAADISASKKLDKNNNFSVDVTAKYLANANRLTPAKSTYCVWAVTDGNGVKNLGQINVKNMKATKFKTSIPFNFSEIFITAEDQGNNTFPSGTEISRIRFEN